MTLSELLTERGYVYQFSSEKLADITDGEKRTLYLGVDPTADSMHVGQLQGLLVLRRFVDAGHKVIVIVGGGTGMVGDPGGKSVERNLLDEETLTRNTEALKKQFSQLLNTADFKMVNNAEWLHPLKYLEFLRDIGKHFTVNEMIKRDSVRTRLETAEQSISYTEFSYMLLQAYDYLELHTRYGCSLQVGGSDQWGNIVSGIDLIRKKTGATAHALSWPLLVDKKTGKKFGKSEGGTVWLDAAKTSPFQFYQFWFNIEDDAVEEMLMKMTLLSRDEVQKVMAEHVEKKGERLPQKKLAHAVTTLVHGESVADTAARASEALFGDFVHATAEEKEMLKTGAPSVVVSVGTPVIDVVVSSGLASSKREAREFIAAGAVSINNEKVEERAVEESDFVEGLALLKRGKRNVSVLIRA